MVCRNCGKCCWYNLNGENKLCKYIKINDDNTTFCTIYKNRAGLVIDKQILVKDYMGVKGKNLVKNIVCGYRKDINRYIEGCTEPGI